MGKGFNGGEIFGIGAMHRGEFGMAGIRSPAIRGRQTLDHLLMSARQTPPEHNGNFNGFVRINWTEAARPDHRDTFAA